VAFCGIWGVIFPGGEGCDCQSCQLQALIPLGFGSSLQGYRVLGGMQRTLLESSWNGPKSRVKSAIRIILRVCLAGATCGREGAA